MKVTDFYDIVSQHARPMGNVCFEYRGTRGKKGRRRQECEHINEVLIHFCVVLFLKILICATDSFECVASWRTHGAHHQHLVWQTRRCAGTPFVRAQWL